MLNNILIKDNKFLQIRVFHHKVKKDKYKYCCPVSWKISFNENKVLSSNNKWTEFYKKFLKQVLRWV